jgi:SAM-dependent methyltransferase
LSPELGAPAGMGRCVPGHTVHSPPSCNLCHVGRRGRAFVAREMMFGLRDEFEYLECSGCGCLQLREPPTDMARYYPFAYYSFQSSQRPLVRWLKRVRIRHLFGHRTLLGRMLVRRFGVPPDVTAVLRSGVRYQDAILDIGCGDGRLLRDLASAGFADLTGIDPHLAQDVQLPSGVLLRRAKLPEVAGPFDLIMMHHAFEHLRDPEAALREVRRLLSPNGQVILRTPLADSYAWRYYGVDWVQLDAPRHIFVHTRRSIRALAERTGFRIRSVHYDSTAFQFWGSEQYRRNLPLRGTGCSGDRPWPSAFTRQQLRDYARRARQLNRRQEGDQASFCLTKES